MILMIISLLMAMIQDPVTDTASLIRQQDNDQELIGGPITDAIIKRLEIVNKRMEDRHALTLTRLQKIQEAIEQLRQASQDQTLRAELLEFKKDRQRIIEAIAEMGRDRKTLLEAVAELRKHRADDVGRFSRIEAMIHKLESLKPDGSIIAAVEKKFSERLEVASQRMRDGPIREGLRLLIWLIVAVAFLAVVAIVGFLIVYKKIES